MKSSKSMEVRLVASLSAGDIRTATRSNIFGIRREFKLDNKPLLDMRGKILEARLEVKVKIAGESCA